MTEVSPILLMILGEVLLVTTLLAGGLLLHKLIKKKRDREAIQNLISRVKEDAPRRDEETRKLMEQRFGFVGDDLKEITAKISREEKAFYQSVINIYLQRDADSIQNLNVDFESAVETYRSLEIPQRDAAETQAAEPMMDTAEIERLSAENERLSSELQITMDTMGRMLNEYSSMFAGGADAELDKAKMVEMLASEKGDAPPSAVDLDAAAADEGAEGVLDATLEQEAASLEGETALDSEISHLQGMLEDEQPGVAKGLLDEHAGEESPAEPTDEADSTDDELEAISLTDEDMSDIADMDRTIVVEPGEEELDAASIDALMESHMDPNR